MAEYRPEEPTITAPPTETPRYDGRQGDHFDDEVSVRGIVGVVIGIAVACLLGFVIVWLLWQFLGGEGSVEEVADASLVAPRLPTGPLLQSHPEEELLEMRAEMAREVEGWHWDDEAAGTVRLPIDAAMELVLARELPSEPIEPETDAVSSLDDGTERGDLESLDFDSSSDASASVEPPPERTIADEMLPADPGTDAEVSGTEAGGDDAADDENDEDGGEG